MTINIKVPLQLGMVLFFGFLSFHFSATDKAKIPLSPDEIFVPLEDVTEDVLIYKPQKTEVQFGCFVSLFRQDNRNCSGNVKSYLDSFIPKVKLKERLSNIHHKVLVSP